MRTSIVHAAFLVAVSLLLAPSHAVADAILSIQPVSSTVSVGNTFAVDVDISGVTDLYDYQFDLNFNPAILQATNVLEGTFLASGGSTSFFAGMVDNTGGTITFVLDTIEGPIPGVTGGGTLAVFDFTAIAPGTGDITILNNEDLILQDSTGTPLNTTTTGGSVEVAAVPEPSALMLLGTGLLVLVGLGLKKTIL